MKYYYIINYIVISVIKYREKTRRNTQHNYYKLYFIYLFRIGTLHVVSICRPIEIIYRNGQSNVQISLQRVNNFQVVINVMQVLIDDFDDIY